MDPIYLKSLTVSDKEIYPHVEPIRSSESITVLNDPSQARYTISLVLAATAVPENFTAKMLADLARLEESDLVMATLDWRVDEKNGCVYVDIGVQKKVKPVSVRKHSMLLDWEQIAGWQPRKLPCEGSPAMTIKSNRDAAQPSKLLMGLLRNSKT